MNQPNGSRSGHASTVVSSAARISKKLRQVRVPQKNSPCLQQERVTARARSSNRTAL